MVNSRLLRMKCIAAVMSILIILGLSLPDPNFASDNFQAKVIKIIDGDSLVVRYQGKAIEVRMWGIDAPEWQQPYSQKAKEFTRRRLTNRWVTIEPKDRDDYKRLVAVVWLGKESINEEMIERGLAWVHIYYCKESICNSWKDVEKKALNERVGLWAGTNPVPPWVWKRKMKH